MRNITLYAYLNINHPMVAWEVAIGRIRSACDLGMEHQNFGISLWQYNLLKKYSVHGSNRRFVNELLLESVRQEKYQAAVSRLRGVYFFESERDAHAAIDRWGIPGNRKFITPVNFSANNTTHVDSEWITSYLNSDETDWMERYWNGDTLGESPLTEVLASGIGMVQSMELREAAYRKIIEMFPESTPLLAMACCGIKHARIESIAQTVPGVIREKDLVKINFYIYIGDLDNRKQELMKAIAACKACNELPPMIRPSTPGIFFRVPDLTNDEFYFKDVEVIRLCDEIHESIRES